MKDFRLLFSNPGTSVEENDLSFNGSKNTMGVLVNESPSHFGLLDHKIVSKGMPFGTYLLYEIRHKLPFRPVVIGYFSAVIDDGGGSEQPATGIMPFYPGGVSNPSPYIWDFFVDDEKVQFRLTASDLSFFGLTEAPDWSGTTCLIRYYIFAQPSDESTQIT